MRSSNQTRLHIRFRRQIVRPKDWLALTVKDRLPTAVSKALRPLWACGWNWVRRNDVKFTRLIVNAGLYFFDRVAHVVRKIRMLLRGRGRHIATIARRIGPRTGIRLRILRTALGAGRSSCCRHISRIALRSAIAPAGPLAAAMLAGRHARLVGVVFDDRRAQPRVASPLLLIHLDELAPLALQDLIQAGELADFAAHGGNFLAAPAHGLVVLRGEPVRRRQHFELLRQSRRRHGGNAWSIGRHRFGSFARSRSCRKTRYSWRGLVPGMVRSGAVWARRIAISASISRPPGRSSRFRASGMMASSLFSATRTDEVPSGIGWSSIFFKRASISSKRALMPWTVFSTALVR